MNIVFAKLAVVGAGAMGRGIAQIAAQAGSQVCLFDTQIDTLQMCIDAIITTWDKQAGKAN